MPLTRTPIGEATYTFLPTVPQSHRFQPPVHRALCPCDDRKFPPILPDTYVPDVPLGGSGHNFARPPLGVKSDDFVSRQRRLYAVRHRAGCPSISHCSRGHCRTRFCILFVLPFGYLQQRCSHGWKHEIRLYSILYLSRFNPNTLNREKQQVTITDT